MRNIAAPLLKSLVFVLVTAVATTVLALTIGSVGLADADEYGATFTDATALNVGDDVRISGVRVGQVEELAVRGPELAHVRFSVERGRTLPADVTAVLKYRNLVGQRYLALVRGPGAGGTLPVGGEIPVERTTPALDLTELFDGFKPLFQALSPKDVNQLSGEIVQVLQGEGGTVDSLISHTGSLTTTLADRDRVIGEVITNLNAVLGTVNERGAQFTELVATLRRLVAGLAEDRTTIGAAVDGLGGLTTATAGLLEQGRKPLRDSISGLGDLSANLVTGQDDLERALTTLPAKFTAVGRLGSYASWMNFYLCSVTLTADPPRGIPLTAGRCR